MSPGHVMACRCHKFTIFFLFFFLFFWYVPDSTHSCVQDQWKFAGFPAGFPAGFTSSSFDCITPSWSVEPFDGAGTVAITFEFDHDLGQLAVCFQVVSTWEEGTNPNSPKQVMLTGFPQGARVRPWARLYDAHESVTIHGWMAA